MPIWSNVNPDLIVIGGAFILGKGILQSIIEKTIFANAYNHPLTIYELRSLNAVLKPVPLGAVAVVLDDILREMVIS